MNLLMHQIHHITQFVLLNQVLPLSPALQRFPSARGGDHLLLCDTAKKIWKVRNATPRAGGPPQGKRLLSQFQLNTEENMLHHAILVSFFLASACIGRRAYRTLVAPFT